MQSTDLHEITALSIDTLKSIVNKHAPKKQTLRNKQRLLQKPWISKGILKSIKIKHTMYKTHFLSRDPSKVCEFKKYSNRLNYLKNISKKTNFCKHFDLCEGNLKATWKLIGTLIKRKTKAQSTPLRIVRINKAYTNNADIADQFNKHFIILAHFWPAKLKTATKTLCNISHHLQPIVLLCFLSLNLKFLPCLKPWMQINHQLIYLTN